MPIPRKSSPTLPAHYQKGGRNFIYAIEETLGADGFRAFCMGNWMKYNARHREKGGEEDLAKAEQYLEWATVGLPELDDPAPAKKSEAKFQLGDTIHNPQLILTKCKVTGINYVERLYTLSPVGLGDRADFYLSFSGQRLWEKVSV